MKSVLIYAGTTEGRELARELAEAGIPSEVCVATEYGTQVMQDEKASQIIRVRQGRLSMEEMRVLLAKNEYFAIVDATHPYATEVTKNIKQSAEGTGLPLFRLARDLREAPELTENCSFFPSAEACAEALCNVDGTILLTTGSKELESFCRKEELRKRLVVRVLPGKESMELCWKNGLEGKQIVAMQGPFTKEMNLATIHQYGITGLVMKESGKVGGADEKLEAAKEADVACFVIRRPAVEEGSVYSFSEVFDTIMKLAEERVQEGQTHAQEHVRLRAGMAENEKEKLEKEDAFLDIVLAGIGMGASGQRTAELENRLARTDYLFGAARMLEGLHAKKESYSYYLTKDILPCLEQIQKKESGRQNVTILFSGDTGFFSGAEKMFQALRGLTSTSVRMLPGLSTVSALSAKFGIRWQDAMILSTHGTAKEQWKAELLFGMRRGRKIFFITSGAEDVWEIGKLLQEQGFGKNYEIKLGYQLSYENEKLMDITAAEAEKMSEAGLYAGFLIPTGDGQDSASAQITPGFGDDTFLRGQVPMTKEEIREISVCKLRLTERAVVYDVGSGTGSIAMEVAALSPWIQVYAIECQDEAIALIQKNKDARGAHNVKIIQAMAPEGMEDLPEPTHVFIGGSKGNLKGILSAVYQKNPRARIVMNAISLESIAQMQEMVKEWPVADLEITTVSVSKAKKAGAYHLMQAANPVTIFSFTFQEER